MGVDDAKRRRLLLQIGQDAHQHDVLDDVGEAAGMKGVTVVHGGGVTTSGDESSPRIRRASTQSRAHLDSHRRDASPGMTDACTQPPRIGGITTWSRRQARRSISSQARNCRSLLMQIRTSLSRVRLQVTAIAGVAQARIDLDEGVLDLGGRHRLRLGQFEIFRRNLHRGARLADGLEIGPRAEPGAGAVLVPFVEDQPGRRHQVQHRGHDVAVEPRRRPLAIFGKAVLILRPQAVDHEGKRPPAALGLRTPARCRARPPPRRTTATTTATARKNRTRRAHSAGDPAPMPSPAAATRDQRRQRQQAERDQKPRNPNIEK